MNIEMNEVSVRDVVEGYEDNRTTGEVKGYSGLLNIRPKYQREFVYKDKQRESVIETVMSGFPLNIMYWVNNNDESYEVLDGQQRTISIAQYVQGDFAIKVNGDLKFFEGLFPEQQEQILNYTMTIYFCSGTGQEKLDWFRTINIAGEKLTNQELRNAIYTGSWLSNAKEYFSRSNCPAKEIGSQYLKGSPIRQDFLETAISWKSNGTIESYMAVHQSDEDANELWTHFNSIISWVNNTFTTYRKEMKGIDWGMLYEESMNKTLDVPVINQNVSRLMADEDVTKKSGIYYYVITGNEKYLSIRAFDERQRRGAYERQAGICPGCTAPNNHYAIEDMDADHITPWVEGGKTIAENCQMLCKRCNRTKGAR